ncbi:MULTISPECIES: tRNA (N(6)-L-threonylcarbamoyladenosine(37)-C(2))-methylthiotransferase MtaB [unclassified Hydrogenobaculum]|uniref:tRNA (N(6)-L-threonylcarbamoyladenosine(37)-C(2))- methylthiotransferase MtaB n=1 Tax=unclassified Hydrogenobaculum TaxID=2622382 RepID=UPI0001C52208|nr:MULTISPECIES: tRNA (N(6)-L-threonylcarbamoyladenosine(37)-C(2))-methylthiotransferase MtaB [unclassified Hydrogenobaculum]AEF19892.1 MiaB-like tRNA modifying enzyme [Hydrogenobaculum sp. 3684]AEG47178.1 MiaB-like tRNA modifying enzyme [Hydrogenobaculum sp. SHO]AGG15826.1 MiaB-like tRNA modifying enzyme [Hydrogenobaculum sp. HO]AGH94126.1 MiaB-like tRNA modifying enzyme [Hydrogenobaculum sp. SN]
MKFKIINLGCRMNQFDGDFISSWLLKHGYEKSEIPDIYIINTCSVTSQADRSSRQAIYQAKKENPNAIVIATGCYAQTQKEALEKLKEVDIVLGNANRTDILEAIKNHLDTKQKLSYVDNIFRQNDITFQEDIIFENHRPFLKIQEGCNSFCSFCIIPFARGKSRSVDEELVIKSVQNLYEKGYKEVVLTGTQLSQYGHDKGTSLYKLLKKLLKIPIFIRLSSMNVNEIKTDKKLLELITEEPNIMPHFHLSLQSASDRLLKAMRREYTLKEYEEVVNFIIKKRPISAIGTDIIVGFPTENQEDFNITYNFLKDFPFAYLHIFTYSDRPLTKAQRLTPKVDSNTKKERSKLLHNLDQEKRERFRASMKGKTLRAITISPDKALTENYIELTPKDLNIDKFEKINDIIMIRL